ncbi:DUF2304 domain-containing protein [Paenibacillus athensensis]|uniref:DUF2304 domain-containing protein n=1 Tax=Paenibacillus athensensis TaxID=1967502 RepID=A0A4Y8PTZ6_9BACL|nr:DUF2304 domain-containing protein [Paenibacillus athensensis]MCD1257986.1 DUF2304 domain-containing protein [Paenibacillus athensensis]
MSIYLASAVFSLVFVFISIELIRRQKLQEQYALLWLTLGVLMTAFSLFPQLLLRLSLAVRVYYAPSLLFAVGLLFSLLFILHLTIVISKLQRRLTRLVQEVALLETRRIQEAGDP